MEERNKKKDINKLAKIRNHPGSHLYHKVYRTNLGTTIENFLKNQKKVNPSLVPMNMSTPLFPHLRYA